MPVSVLPPKTPGSTGSSTDQGCRGFSANMVRGGKRGQAVWTSKVTRDGL